MTQQYTPNLGQTPAGDARRDAVHVAVVPVICGEVEPLLPGQKVGILYRDARCTYCGVGAPEYIGVVDPYLTDPVEENQPFWLLLFPNTITDLRHVWRHKSFTVAAPTVHPVHPVQEEE